MRVDAAVRIAGHDGAARCLRAEDRGVVADGGLDEGHDGAVLGYVEGRRHLAAAAATCALGVGRPGIAWSVGASATTELHFDNRSLPAPVSKSSTAEIALAHWLSGRLKSTGLALTASLFASSAVKSQISMV